MYLSYSGVFNKRGEALTMRLDAVLGRKVSQASHGREASPCETA